jgi:methyltransferase
VALALDGFLGLLGAVALMRVVELAISRRHEHLLELRGARRARDPYFHWMVLLHAGILAGAALEVLLLERRFIPVLGAAMIALFICCNVVRWWVIRSLGTHWNVHVVDSLSLGIVTNGPFRLVRHPNYSAVFLELLALPLIHTAWLTAVAGAAAHAWVLSQRIRLEERVLHRHPDYQAAMVDKPRFIPKLTAS